MNPDPPVALTFFSKSQLSHLLIYIYDILHTFKILEKSLEQFLRKTIMDVHTDTQIDGLKWAITKAPSTVDSIQNNMSTIPFPLLEF